MKIKSYYARSVETAMAMARQEMGPDAMLINSRKAPPEARHLGEYEVVFGATEDPVPPAARTDSAPGARAVSDRLSVEVAELKKELENMRRTLTRTAFPPPQWLNGAPDLSDAYAVLTSGDVDPSLAHDIVQSAEARIAEPGTRKTRPSEWRENAAFQRALIEELQSRFSVQPLLGKTEGGLRIAALIGPPGSGKTTTLVKLAVNYGLACRRPVMLLSMDNFRVAAVDQLRSYAAILGVGFQALDTLGSLAQTIEESRNKDLILIDTPGLGYGEIDHFGNLAQFLGTRPDIDKHLVLPASVKAADLRRMVDSYDIFKPDRLLFTRMDETVSFGPILNETARTGKPLSFFANGQRIPEDLEEAVPSRLINLILTGSADKARTAA